ncbi:hypothetical protein [Actinophytocola oryzae]|uniref:Uncharacterized protein n=1 Tax=Actinophytocola oryzae TaxID=502181 RepID=A0A4R7UU71_9PSEU|nr:hypothetical protein [Actinophytocola oryzae]TDV38712.1 hypothetical protein CLV71_12698 [Actinophytocola oryzae]
MKARSRVTAPAVPETGWGGDVVGTDSEDVRELLRAERRRRRGRWFAGGLVVVAVGAVATLLFRSSVFEPVAGDAGSSTSPVSGTRGELVDLTRPFAGTPASVWPDGAAGIVPPAPEPVGGFTSQQVTQATQLVRDVLIASRLDNRMLVGHDPSAYLALLAPDARRQLEPLFASGREPEVQSLVSLTAPGSELLPVGPKVSGTMTVRAGDAGELVVHTNYVFAYAFAPPAPLRLIDAMNTIVVVRADVDYVMRAGDRWTPNSRGLWFDDATGFGYSIGCDAYRKGFLAPVTTERNVTSQPDDVQPGGYFDPTSPLPPAGGCRR